MTWSTEHQMQARAEGWDLIHVIDNGTAHPYFQLWPHGGVFKNTEAVQQFVMKRARAGSPLAIQALRAMTASRVRKAPPKKGRK